MSKVKLGSVTDSCLGKMLDAEKNKGSYQLYLANLNVRWGSFDLNNLSQMRFEDHEQERYGIRAGDLIMCEGGEPGRCAIWRDELPNMKIQKALHRIRPHACLDVHYLYYWFLLAGRLGWLDRHFTETTIKHLPGDRLKDIEIDMPSLAMQKGIADVLSSIDDKITHNAHVCAELESMAKTLYDYWFVQFDFPDANGKPYRASGGEMVWNEQLKREIPKGWSTKKIGELLASIPNTVRIQTGEYKAAGKIPVIDQSTDFIAGYTDDDNSVLHSEHGHIVFGDHTRIVKYIRFPFARGADGTQIISSNDDRIPNELFYQAIKNIDLSNYGYARHFKFLKDTPVIVPTEKVAHEYIDIVKSMYDKTVQLLFENIELSKLRDWLLPMLMNGQATVTPAEPAPKLQVLQPDKPARDPRFDRWLQTQGVAARGTVDEQTLHDIFDAMDDDDKQ